MNDTNFNHLLISNVRESWFFFRFRFCIRFPHLIDQIRDHTYYQLKASVFNHQLIIEFKWKCWFKFWHSVHFVWVCVHFLMHVHTGEKRKSALVLWIWWMRGTEMNIGKKCNWKETLNEWSQRSVRSLRWWRLSLPSLPCLNCHQILLPHPTKISNQINYISRSLSRCIGTLQADCKIGTEPSPSDNQFYTQQFERTTKKRIK